MVAKPSARLNVVTLPEPCPIGYAASDGSVPSSRRLDQPDQQVLRAADFAVHLDGESGRNDRPLLRAAARQQANHRRHEFVEGEDRRGRESRQHHHSAPAGRGEADRLAGLERHAVRDDPGIVEFGDHAIGHVARALAGSARQQHDVGEFERVSQPFAQGVDVVMRDAQPPRLAAQFAHGVGEHLRRWNRRPWRVASSSPGAMISSPVERIATIGLRQTLTCATPIAASTPVSRLVSSWPRRSTVSPAVMSVPANDTPLPAVTARAMRSSPAALSPACSTITTASAPRGTMPPVAINTASPG